MLFIQKMRTPLEVKKAAKKIKQTPDNGYKSIKLPGDTGQLRSLFDLMPREVIREALCEEQHGLCAYCVRAIQPERLGNRETEADSTKIEHDVDETKKGAVILSCDASRTDRRLTINPWDQRQMEAIGYERNGKIFIRTDVGLELTLTMAMQKDIDEELMLNGKMDGDGKVIFDTASKLVANRKQIYDSTCTQFERWDKKGCLTPEFLKEKIVMLENQLRGKRAADPYIGVRIYFYRRKYNKLRRRESR